MNSQADTDYLSKFIKIMNAQKTIEDNGQYTISQSGSDLVFTWKYVAGLSIKDMASGIKSFATHCKSLKPHRAVIDARQLDPKSPGLGWVSGQQKFEEQEEYKPWWLREIIPLYNEAGISSLAVATGNPQAPGETETPGAKFKMGYLNSLDDAMNFNQ